MESRLAEILETSLAQERAGKMAEALQLARQARELAQSVNDREGLCHSTAQSAWFFFRIGRQDEASRLATEALTYAGEDPGTVRALAILAICAAQMSDLNQAEELFLRSIDLSRQIGFPRGLAIGLHNLAYLVYLRRGQFNRALETIRQVHEIADEVGFPIWGYPMMQVQIYQLTGARDEARQALVQVERVSDRGWTPKVYLHVFRALLALDEHQLAFAAESLQAARSIAEPIGHPQVTAWIRIVLSRLYRMQDDGPAARAWADEALQIVRRANYAPMEGEVLIARAQAHWVCEDFSAAETDLRSALEISKRFSAACDLAQVSFLLASLYHRQGRPEAHAVWLDAANRILVGGYEFILERERELAFPLLSAYLHSSDPLLRTATDKLLDHLSRIPPLPLHIVGLGRFQVTQGHRAIPERVWERRKAGELFRYLLLQPTHSAPRDSVLEALWPGYTPASAERLFHQATFTLRHILEPDLPDKFPSRYFHVENDAATLRLPSGSTVDWREFEQQLDQALRGEDADLIARALTLYGGELFSLDRYADWSVGPRERLAELETRGLVTLARLRLASGDAQQALDVSRRILEQEPWLEEAVLIGMRACLSLNDRPGALLLYRALEKTLRDDLGLAPRPELCELAARVVGDH